MTGMIYWLPTSSMRTRSRIPGFMVWWGSAGSGISSFSIMIWSACRHYQQLYRFHAISVMMLPFMKYITWRIISLATGASFSMFTKWITTDHAKVWQWRYQGRWTWKCKNLAWPDEWNRLPESSSFDGMITADAYLWAKYRDDKSLQENLVKITQATMDSRRGYYGTTGNQCVIKNSLILKDVKIGSNCYIKGANKLKNLTINSSAQEPTRSVKALNSLTYYRLRMSYFLWL